jgi:transcriptional regulator with XRE-family HTH domain
VTEELTKRKYKECSPELLGVLAANIVQLREVKGLSQEQLAEMAGMHRTFISLIERKGRNVTLGAIEALAVALEVGVPDLLTPQELR